MGNTLSALMGASEPLFRRTVQELEAATGHPNEDIRFSTEIIAKLHQKTKELGLDPHDTTPKELYHALQSLTSSHAEFLTRALGVKDPTDIEEVVACAQKAMNKLGVPRSCWVLKHSVAKRLIKANPPKQVMKQLGYKSLDSMLKRENIADIYAAIGWIETPKWAERFAKHYIHLQPGDFEKRNIEVRVLSGKRWQALGATLVRSRHQNIFAVKELGAIEILSLATPSQKGLCLVVFPLLLYSINEIRIASSYVKMHQVKPRFGRRVQEAFSKHLPTVAALVSSQQIHWRSIQRRFGQQGNKLHPDIFEPHIQPEDLSWRQAADLLYKLEPALKFWEELDYVGLVTDKFPVSLNLIDNAISYFNGLEYGQQSVSYLHESLRYELQARYLQYEGLQDEVFRQLEDDATLSGVMLKVSEV